MFFRLLEEQEKRVAMIQTLESMAEHLDRHHGESISAELAYNARHVLPVCLCVWRISELVMGYLGSSRALGRVRKVTRAYWPADATACGHAEHSRSRTTGEFYSFVWLLFFSISVLFCFCLYMCVRVCKSNTVIF